MPLPAGIPVRELPPDNRIYAAKPAPGPIEVSLGAMLPTAVLATKSERHATLNLGVKGWTTSEGVAIALAKPPRFDADRNWLEVELTAVNQGGAPLPLDNPYHFVNPPLKVPDGTWRKETLPTGEEIAVMNTVEDVSAAFQAMVSDAVLHVARANGWKG
jgi:hypothetical protein